VTNLVVSAAPEKQIRFEDPPDADRDPARQLQKVLIRRAGFITRPEQRGGVNQVALFVKLFNSFHDGICVRQSVLLLIVKRAFKPRSFLAWLTISSFLWKETS
jgi:hypothetical protein